MLCLGGVGDGVLQRKTSHVGINMSMETVVWRVCGWSGMVVSFERVRVQLGKTERQISATIGLDSSVLKRRVRRAAGTLTTFHVGSDGVTVHQRV